MSATALPAHCAAVFLGMAGLMLVGSVLATQLPFVDGDFGATVGAFSGLVVGAILLRLYDSRSGGLHLQRRLVVKPSESI
jgi:positive regulator of sigma E activity